MTYQIELPQGLFAEWWTEGVKEHGFAACFVARKAAEWGFRKGIEKCCEYIGGEGEWFANPEHRLAELRAKLLPTLKQEAARELVLLREEMKRHGLEVPATPALTKAITSLPEE